MHWQIAQFAKLYHMPPSAANLNGRSLRSRQRLSALSHRMPAAARGEARTPGRCGAWLLLCCCVLPLLSATLGVARAGGTDEHGRTARHSLCHLLMAGSRPCLTTSSTIVCARGRPRNLGIKHRIINSLQCHHIPDSAKSKNLQTRQYSTSYTRST